jgi:hypothetical protein
VGQMNSCLQGLLEWNKGSMSGSRGTFGFLPYSWVLNQEGWLLSAVANRGWKSNVSICSDFWQ